jgi:hypothetical protein
MSPSASGWAGSRRQTRLSGKVADSYLAFCEADQMWGGTQALKPTYPSK